MEQEFAEKVSAPPRACCPGLVCPPLVCFCFCSVPPFCFASIYFRLFGPLAESTAPHRCRRGLNALGLLSGDTSSFICLGGMHEQIDSAARAAMLVFFADGAFTVFLLHNDDHSKESFFGVRMSFRSILPTSISIAAFHQPHSHRHRPSAKSEPPPNPQL